MQVNNTNIDACLQAVEQHLIVSGARGSSQDSHSARHSCYDRATSVQASFSMSATLPQPKQLHAALMQILQRSREEHLNILLVEERHGQDHSVAEPADPVRLRLRSAHGLCPWRATGRHGCVPLEKVLTDLVRLFAFLL